MFCKSTRRRGISSLFTSFFIALLISLGTYIVALSSLHRQATFDTKTNWQAHWPQSKKRAGCGGLDASREEQLAPTFVIVGTQKAGTTALYSQLQIHPEIARPRRPETHFFDRHGLVRKHRNDLNDTTVICELRQAYSRVLRLNTPAAMKRHRQQQPRQLITFEKTPSYILHEFVPAVMHAVVPRTKIVAILRDPIERMVSQYRMKLERANFSVANGGRLLDEDLANEIAVLHKQGFDVPQPMPRNKRRPRRKDLRHWRERSMLYRGCYVDQLQRWLEHYELGQNLLVLPYEKVQTGAALQDILAFVGLEPYSFPERVLQTRYSPVAGNATTRPIHLRKATRAYLERFFQACNQQLPDLLGEEWRDRWY